MPKSKKRRRPTPRPSVTPRYFSAHPGGHRSRVKAIGMIVLVGLVALTTVLALGLPNIATGATGTDIHEPASHQSATTPETPQTEPSASPNAEPATVVEDTQKPQAAPTPDVPAVTAAPKAEPVASGVMGSTNAPAAEVCGSAIPGAVPAAAGRSGAGNITGTTTADLQAFADKYNAIRAANCLPPVAPSHFRADACMLDRLIWMAEDPSTDPASAWGHIGSQRSDGVPSVGCDGNLAGGASNTGATVAQKWWDSPDHRASLYRPTVTVTGAVCIFFAMSHGGIPNESASYARAAARWGNC